MRELLGVFTPGAHLALEHVARFVHPVDRAFVAATCRVELFKDNGSSLEVWPVHEKTGERMLSDQMPEGNVYHIDRESFRGPWSVLSGVRVCYACRGRGKQSAHKAAASEVDEEGSEVIAKCGEPFCLRKPKCGSSWSRSNASVRVLGGDVRLCGTCGRVIRNAHARYLRDLAKKSETTTVRQLELVGQRARKEDDRG